MARTIELPPVVAKLPEYIEHGSGHIHVVLAGEDLRRFRQLQADLVAGARLQDGSPVARKIDVFKWILEQAERAATTKTTKTTKKRDLNGKGQ